MCFVHYSKFPKEPESVETELRSGKVYTSEGAPAVFAEAGGDGLFPDKGKLFALGVLVVGVNVSK